MKKTFYLLLVFLLPLFTNAQRWKAERESVVLGVGTSHFMGDLGGGAKDAAHFFGVRDLDFVTTRPSVQLGYRYRAWETISFRPTVTYSLLSAKDAASGSIGRQSRNLEFRSHVWEAGVQAEWAFIKEKPAARYNFSSLGAIRMMSAFLIVGGGGMYYNPKARATVGTGKEWTELRGLGTEGQGHGIESYTYHNPSTGESSTVKIADPYGKFTWNAAIGLGMKWNINRHWSLGLEITNRYTGSDYIDDTSGSYYNFAQAQAGGLTDQVGEWNGKIAETEGALSNAILFGDRNLVYTEDGVTEVLDDKNPMGHPKRGDSEYNDAYILSIVQVHYKFKNTFRGLPKF